MVLNKKEFDFLEEVINKQKLNLNEMAKKLNLTERAIRYKIENINYYLSKNKLKEKLILNRGFIELIGNEENINNTLNTLSEKNYIFSSDERIEYTIVKLLFLKNIKIEDVCEELDISRSTAKKDVKILREIIDNEKLSLTSKPGIGLILEGDEKDIRKMLLKYFSEYFDIKNYDTLVFREKIAPISNRVNLILKEYLENNFEVDVKFIFYFLKGLEKEMDKIISDEGYKIMIFYMIISLHRILKGNVLDNPIPNELFLKNTAEYSIIKDKIFEIEKKFNMTFRSNEILQFTEYFLGTHSYNFKYSFYENWIEIETLVRDLVAEVEKDLNTEIRTDTSLIEGLINHLRPTIYRIKNNIKLENPIYESVITEYPELFYLVEKSLKKLEDFLNRKIYKEEVAFLTVHFKLAIDRNIKKIPKKNILIVCEYGYGTSRLLSQEISNKFDVNIVGIVPFNKVINNEINEEKIDLIISTLDFTMKKSTPIVKVSAVLSEKDVKNLEKLGLKNHKTSLYFSDILSIIEKNTKIQNIKNLENDLKNYFGDKLIMDLDLKKQRSLLKMLPIENIKIIETCENWEMATRMSSQILIDNEYTNIGYTEKVIKTIIDSGPYMIIGKETILPHAGVKKHVNKTGFSFLKLKNAVEFPEGNMIKNIITLSSIDKEEHIEALLELKKIIDKTNFLDCVESVTTSEDLLDLIIEKVSQVK